MCKDFSWSELYQHRRAAAARFGKIFSLPIVKRVREVLLSVVHDGESVLEIGAGDRGMLDWLREGRRNVSYESMDIDRNGTHEYHDLAEITKTYDCVCAFEVIEHLTLDEIRPWLHKLGELLKSGGHLVLSTPNTYYPPAYLRDATHRTPLCYDELAGLVQASGLALSSSLTVERIVRIYHDPLPRRLLRQYLFGWLFRLIGIDFAKQIVLVAVKASQVS